MDKREMEKTVVYLVEDHNDALEGIYREIGRKLLPMSDCFLLHFDSHSDLSVPKSLSKDDVFKKDVLFSKLSIENWIIPAVFAGHIGTVVWIKPPWTEESFERFSTFKVGYHSASNEIRVNSKSNYFLSELSYASEEEMLDSKPVKLIVLPFSDENLDEKINTKDHLLDGDKIDPQITPHKRNFDEPELSIHSIHDDNPNKKCKLNHDELELSCTNSLLVPNKFEIDELFSDGKMPFLKEIGTLLEDFSNSFILDIDLDFFSTTNPIQTMFTARQRDLLKSLYEFVPPKGQSENSIHECLTYRQNQLSYLEAAMTSLQNCKPVNFADSKRDNFLKELIEDLKCQSLSQDVDFDWLHEIGTGIDDCDLPHHISSEEEIDALLLRVEQMLRSLPKPTLITVARSSSDDYCPSDQVEYIQKKTLDMLSRIYENLDIKLTYQ